MKPGVTAAPLVSPGQGGAPPCSGPPPLLCSQAARLQLAQRRLDLASTPSCSRARQTAAASIGSSRSTPVPLPAPRRRRRRLQRRMRAAAALSCGTRQARGARARAASSAARRAACAAAQRSAAHGQQPAAGSRRQLTAKARFSWRQSQPRGSAVLLWKQLKASTKGAPHGPSLRSLTHGQSSAALIACSCRCRASSSSCCWAPAASGGPSGGGCSGVQQRVVCPRRALGPKRPGRQKQENCAHHPCTPSPVARPPCVIAPIALCLAHERAAPVGLGSRGSHEAQLSAARLGARCPCADRRAATYAMFGSSRGVYGRARGGAARGGRKRWRWQRWRVVRAARELWKRAMCNLRRADGGRLVQANPAPSRLPACLPRCCSCCKTSAMAAAMQRSLITPLGTGIGPRRATAAAHQHSQGSTPGNRNPSRACRETRAKPDAAMDTAALRSPGCTAAAPTRWLRGAGPRPPLAAPARPRLPSAPLAAQRAPDHTSLLVAAGRPCAGTPPSPSSRPPGSPAARRCRTRGGSTARRRARRPLVRRRAAARATGCCWWAARRRCC